MKYQDKEISTGKSEIQGDGGTVTESGSMPREGWDEGYQRSVCIVGLGFVGIPLAVQCASANHQVIGYDVDHEKITSLRNGTDPTRDFDAHQLEKDNLSFTTDPSCISSVDFVIVTVPTPVDGYDKPDLTYVQSAAETIGRQLTPNTTVILESTVYPGATREVFIPTIEQHSGYTAPADFGVGYSPERITPGDPDHTISNVVKIVSALSEENLDRIATFYETIINVGVHRAPSIEVAEASKVVENMQRDLNIAFVNELAMAFERIQLDLSTHDVLEAARTKCNFHDYRPGLVGGHCIPVDPYFFTNRSKQAGFSPELVLTGRKVNESIPQHIADLTIKELNKNGVAGANAKIVVLGLAYKPDVPDIRTSKITGVINRFLEFGIDVAGFDPVADNQAMEDVFGIPIQSELSFDNVDAVILATSHTEFHSINLEAMARDANPNAVLVDVPGFFIPDEAEQTGLTYRRL